MLTIQPRIDAMGGWTCNATHRAGASIFHFDVDRRFPSFAGFPRSRSPCIRKLSCASDQLHRALANRVLLSALATCCQLALVSVESFVPIFVGANRVS